MKKILLLALMIFPVGMVVVGSNQIANAQVDAASYNVAYTATNFYAENTVLWSFSGLDANTVYLWTIELVNDNDVSIRILGSRLFTGGTTYTLTWGAGVPPFGDEWPQNYIGPMRVRDNFGQIVSRHFIAPTPVTDWTTTSGNTAQGLKQTPGVPVSEGNCRAPVYWDINADGWHHTFVPCTVQIVPGDYFLLHYRLDVAEYGNGDLIAFDVMPGNTNEVIYDLDNIIDYNFGGSISGISDVNTRSFVVVNTSDELLPFIDYSKSDAAFTSLGDPHRGSVTLGTFNEPGAYNCVRFATGFVWESDCESVLLISEQVPQERWTGSEWSIDALIDPVATSGFQRVRRNLYTEEIWNAYNGSWEVTDSQQGSVDTNVYAFGDIPTFEFLTGSVAGSAEVEWRIEPSGLDSNLMTNDEAAFIVEDTYTLQVELGIVDPTADLLEVLGFDTPLGNIVALTIIMVLALMASLMFTKMFFVQLIIFEAVGGLFIVFGFANTLTTVLFATGSVVLWVWYFAMARGDKFDV